LGRAVWGTNAWASTARRAATKKSCLNMIGLWWCGVEGGRAW
jgi:hypothetical protein